MSNKFLNVSNHPSANWSEKQLSAAGENVLDLRFPSVPATASTEEIHELSVELYREIMKHEPETVMLQGEMSLTFATALKLHHSGVRVVCACSERKTVESVDADGNTVKTAIFEFVQFRDYFI